MFKFFSSLFSKKNKTKSTKNTNTHNFLCSLNLELSLDDNINILCYWPDLDSLSDNEIKTLASKYASLIYLADSGQMKKEIVNTLLSVNEKNNQHDTIFIEYLLYSWANLVDSDNGDGPVIKPSNVFKNYNK